MFQKLILKKSNGIFHNFPENKNPFLRKGMENFINLNFFLNLPLVLQSSFKSPGRRRKVNMKIQ